jgi:hypothetical protein
MIEDFFAFATGVVDTSGKPWAANISENFRKNSKRPYWYTQGLRENWFMKKTRSQKSRDTVPLRSIGYHSKWQSNEEVLCKPDHAPADGTQCIGYPSE